MEVNWHPDIEFKMGRRIGEGSFAEVYSGQWQGQPVAVKKFRDLPVRHEISINQRLFSHPSIRECPHLVQTKSILGTRSVPLGLIMELCDTDLAARLEHKQDLREWYSAEEIIRLIIQLCQAVQCLHEVGFVHLDISPMNICLENDMVKLCDFGAGDFIGSTVMPIPPKERGTRLAPECYQDSMVVTPAMDIYAIGQVACLMMSLGKCSHYNRFTETIQQKYSHLIPIIALMMDSNPIHRPSAAEAIIMLSTPPRIPSNCCVVL
jgi:serine/threonine protein kinase